MPAYFEDTPLSREDRLTFAVHNAAFQGAEFWLEGGIWFYNGSVYHAN
jgi:hypothetical protein